VKIVLATPPAEGSKCGPGMPPPLGLIYVATAAQKALKEKITLIDAFSEGLDAEEAKARVLAHQPDIFGLSVMSTNINRGLKLLKLVKQARPTVTTVLGGQHATLFDRLILREIPEVDMVLRGEGEESFPKLCQTLQANRSLQGLPGVSYRNRGKNIQGQPQVIKDLDALPFPDRTIPDYQGYYTQWGYWQTDVGVPATSILSSRGCPGHCTFCTRIPAELSRWRPRSPENVVRELRQLSRDGYKIVIFVDENLTVSIAHINHLCRLLIQENLPMRFAFEGFVEHLPDSTLGLMRQAGFDLFLLGVESGSDPQRRRYKKTGSAQAVAQGIQRAKKHHFLVYAWLLIGGPRETRADLENTKDFLRKAQPHLINIGNLRVHPGSQLWHELVGPGEPATLKEADSREIFDFPGQADQITLAKQAKELYGYYLKKFFLRRGALLDLLGLIKHNPLVQLFLRCSLNKPSLILQLLKTRYSG
jgi:anaerobic magnesium-protoporphyrin IX monomethyl ester cyclase